MKLFHFIFYVLFSCVITVQGNPNGQCPPGVTLEECEIDPCEFASCPGHEDATCIANYCGGCIADFYVDGTKVTCGENQRVRRSGDQCPPGVTLEECELDPCEFTSCPGHNDAQCIPNYCGGCNADFYEDGVKVTCEESKFSKRSIKECPDSDKLNCFVDPCFTAECPAHPKAKCKPNYCGECHADFFNDEGHVVDCHKEEDAPQALRRTMLDEEIEERDARSGASRPRLLEL